MVFFLFLFSYPLWHWCYCIKGYKCFIFFLFSWHAFVIDKDEAVGAGGSQSSGSEVLDNQQHTATNCITVILAHCCIYIINACFSICFFSYRFYLRNYVSMNAVKTRNFPKPSTNSSLHPRLQYARLYFLVQLKSRACFTFKNNLHLGIIIFI